VRNVTIFNLPRHQRTPETEVDVLLTNLSVLYSELNPAENKYAFINEVFREFYGNENTNGDILAREVNRIMPVNNAGVSEVNLMAALYISCAYCCQAQRAWDAKHINDAWTFVVDARYWCSILMSRHPGIDRLEQEKHAAQVSKIRSKSRLKGVEKYDYSDFILSMYRSKPWKNKTEAIKEINEALKLHISENNLPVRMFKFTNEREDIIEEKQSDFCKYIARYLPSAKQIKEDSGRWSKPD
jgi:hypothetical protein